MSQGSTDTDKVTYKDTDTVTLTDQVTDTAGSQDWSGIHFTSGLRATVNISGVQTTTNSSPDSVLVTIWHDPAAPRRWRSQNASYLTEVNMHSSVTRQYKNGK